MALAPASKEAAGATSGRHENLHRAKGRRRERPSRQDASLLRNRLDQDAANCFRGNGRPGLRQPRSAPSPLPVAEQGDQLGVLFVVAGQHDLVIVNGFNRANAMNIRIPIEGARDGLIAGEIA